MLIYNVIFRPRGTRGRTESQEGVFCERRLNLGQWPPTFS